MLVFNTSFSNSNNNTTSIINDIINDTSCFLPHFKEVYTSPLRYFDIKSGRGGAKTSQIARIIAKESFLPELKNTNFACGRKFATNIKETSYSTVELHIKENGWERYFHFTPSRKTIYNKYNNVFIYFMGCQDPDAFTSIPNLSRVWLDEVAFIDRFRIDRIFKSVRGKITGGSHYKTKIYSTYNPITNLDPISSYLNERVRGGIGLTVHKNIFDLPEDWQDQDLLIEARIDKDNDIDLFNHIWLGMPHPDIQENLFENVTFSNLEQIPKQSCIAFLDPSFIGGDTSAITLVWVNKSIINVTGYCFKNAWYELDYILNDLMKTFKINRFYYENNMLGDSISNHYYSLYGKVLIPITSTTNKVARIYKLGYYLKRMRFFKSKNIFNSHKNSSNMWVKQIQEYNRLVSTKPKANEHDDAPDSLASLFVAEKWL